MRLGVGDEVRKVALQFKGQLEGHFARGQLVDPAGPPARVEQAGFDRLDQGRLDSAGMLVAALGRKLDQRLVQPAKFPALDSAGREAFLDRQAMHGRSVDVDHVERFGLVTSDQRPGVVRHVAGQQRGRDVDAQASRQAPGQVSIVDGRRESQPRRLLGQLREHRIGLDPIGRQRQMRTMFLHRRVDAERQDPRPAVRTAGTPGPATRRLRTSPSLRPGDASPV